MTLTELAAQSQRKAVDAAQHILRTGYDPRDLHEEWRDILTEEGFEDPDIRANLSYSQGDGVAMYGRIDTATYCKKHDFHPGCHPARAKLNNCDHTFLSNVGIQSHRTGSLYDHYNTMRIQVTHWGDDADLTPEQNRFLVDLEHHVKTRLQELSRRFEREGYDHHDDETSEAAAREWLTVNQVPLNADGTLA